MQVTVTDEMIGVYEHISCVVAVAEASKLGRQQRPDGSIGEVFYFNRINVPHYFTGEGYGNKLLKTLLNECRNRNIALILEISPYGDMTYKQLEAWYKRNGFKEFDGVLWFIP